MKKLRLTDFKFLFILLLACSVKLHAQVTDANKDGRRDTLPYKQNNNQQYLSQYSTKNERAQDSVTEVRLVELALRQPKFDEAEAQRKTIDLQLEKERKAWLNLLSLSVNYNDQTFAGKSNTQTAYVYPKYFFGVTVPLGLIFSHVYVYALILLRRFRKVQTKIQCSWRILMVMASLICLAPIRIIT